MTATLYPQYDMPLWQDMEPRREGSLAAASFAFREGLRDRFPPRYGTDVWRKRFDARLVTALEPGLEILDVGAGAWPMVPIARRPRGTTYVGLDIDEVELRSAPAGTYDEVVVSDITEPRSDLEDRFDLLLSWFVLEHVSSLPAALDTMRRYLKPGGRLLAQFSGRYAIFSLINRLVPDRLSSTILRRTTGREPETVFPAHYDRCRHDQIVPLLERRWADWEVLSIFVAGLYCRFWHPLLAVYLAFEEVAWQRRWENLAAYYLIDSRRPMGAEA